MLAAAKAGIGLSGVPVVAAPVGLPAGAILPGYLQGSTSRGESVVDVAPVHPAGLIRNVRWSDGTWR